MNKWLNQRDNSQYSRNECLETTAVPGSISNDDLEETTIKTFDKLSVATDPSNIQDYHWLKSNGPKKVIIQFTRRENANLIQKKKKKVEGNESLLNWYHNPVFINDSLCSYYKMLWRKCEKLWSSKSIHALWVTNATLRRRLTTSGHVHVIIRSQDLDELFPENKLLSDE